MATRGTSLTRRNDAIDRKSSVGPFLVGAAVGAVGIWFALRLLRIVVGFVFGVVQVALLIGAIWLVVRFVRGPRGG